MNKNLSRMEKDLLRAYANCGMNATEAGRILYRTGTNVWYHLTVIKKKTGKDPRDFWQLCELLGMKRQEEIERICPINGAPCSECKPGSPCAKEG